MGKNEKARIGEAPLSEVTLQRLAHMYDPDQLSHPVLIRSARGGFSVATAGSTTSLAIQQVMLRNTNFPQTPDAYILDHQNQAAEADYSQKGQKLKYNNKPPQGRRSR